MTNARVAVAQISSESNHFVPFLCEVSNFTDTGYLLEGAEVGNLSGTSSEVAGMLEILDQTAPDVEPVTLLAARANSSGPLSATCYRYLHGRLLDALERARPIHGILLSLHGSMAAEGEDDPEGDIAQAVRGLLGSDAPIVMTLDLHGNITERMVAATDAIIGYQHYPHDDTRETGARAAELLLGILQENVKPVVAHTRIPMVISPFKSMTPGDSPFDRLMQLARETEQHPRVLQASLFPVHPSLDVPEMGSSVVVVADRDSTVARELAERLARDFWEAHEEFQVETMSVAEAVRRGRALGDGPVLLLDTADTTGGGAAGDSIALVKELLAAGVTEHCLATVVDPGAAKECWEAGTGTEITVRVGHQLDPKWGEPVELTGRIIRLLDGRFVYKGGILGGASASMGPSAVLRVGNIDLLIASTPTYEWGDEQYRCAGLDPKHATFVGVKNAMNFRHAYRDVMKGYFVLDLPGPTSADVSTLPYRRVRRPLFPLDEISEPEFTITSSSPR